MTAIVSLVVVLGILILIHEFGHFIVARLSGVGVERFSIGLGPVIWRIFKGKGTEYVLSAVPFGGYVKMMGDDENPLEGGKSGVVDPARAFNRKPIWVRFLIVVAGPGMNFVLAAVIFAVVFMVLGQPVAPNVVGRVARDGSAAEAGLRAGDRIVAVDGKPVLHWEDLLVAAQASHGAPLRLVVRDEKGDRTVTLTPRKTKVRDPIGEEQEAWDVGAGYYSPASIGEVKTEYPAAAAGLKPGDTVLALDGQPVASWEDLATAIRERPGRRIRLEVKRGKDLFTLSVVPRAEKERTPDGREIEIGRIGIGPGTSVMFVRSSPPAAVWQGVYRAGQITALTVRALYKIVVGQLDRKAIGSPIQIAVTAGEQARQGLASLAFFTAVISINLFVLNLLPVPMLDGGHLLFFSFEAVLGRPLSVRKREVAQQVGFVLLMMLMAYAVYNDLDRYNVFRIFR